MIDIYEVEINMCDFRGTIQCSDIKKLYETCSEKVKAITDIDIKYARLGYEFCENGLLHTNPDKLIENMQWLYGQGIKIIFVLPPMHQRYMEMYQVFLLKLFKYDLIDEIVVNDIGTLSLMREKLNWNGKITFGRLFDKSVREIRLNLFENWNHEAYADTAFLPSVMGNYQKKLSKKWNIDSFETDTLPDGVLDATSWDKDYKVHIHYPRIVLSKSAYCEFAQNNCQFEARCSGTCLKYGKTIVREGRRMIYKEGLLIYGKQPKPLEEVVNGKIRLIYSEG